MLSNRTPPAIGLGLEPASPQQMQAPPRLRQHGLFRTSNLIDIFFYGFVVGIIGLCNFAVAMYTYGGGNFGLDCNKSYNDSCGMVFRARGALFVTSCCILLMHSFTCRDLRNPVWSPSFFVGERRWYLAWVPRAFTCKQNWYLYYSAIFGIVLLILTVYIPV